MSQRFIVKCSDAYPWESLEVTSNTHIHGNDAPPISIRKKAVSNGWWIEKKEYAAGTNKAGQVYWQFIKDPSTVSNLVNSNVGSNPTPSPKKSTTTPPKPKKVKVTVWGERDFSVENGKYKSKSVKELLVPENVPSNVPGVGSSDEDIVKFIGGSYAHKPNFLDMSVTKWKLMVRSALRGDNILILGDKGEGKTMSAVALANSLSRPLFVVNFGHMQDAQTALIGKTHLDSKKGTFFSKSYFVEAITTPNAIVLMDELTRASDDAFNIIMPVLDKNQRYLRLNDEVNSPKVSVDPGVCFVATANVGHEYSSTRTLDAALSDRFTTKLEVDRLSVDSRVKIMRTLYPVVMDAVLRKVAGFINDVNEKVYAGEGELNKPLSTRTGIAIASLIYDGLTVVEAIENTVFPDYPDVSERTYLRQLLQGYDLDGYEKKNQVYHSQVTSEVEVDA